METAQVEFHDELVQNGLSAEGAVEKGENLAGSVERMCCGGDGRAKVGRVIGRKTTVLIAAVGQLGFQLAFQTI